MVTLLLASKADNASVNLYEAVVELGGWSKSEQFDYGLVKSHSVRPVHLLLIEKLHIHADGIDIIHEEEIGESVDEVLVLSRHAAKSGIPSLTVHAIGVPGEVPHGEVGFAGGEKGLAAPPSPRFSAIYSALREETADSTLAEEFDVSLETTHHGPVLTKPTLYLEIGSKESEWVRKDASELWARVISRVLGLSDNDPEGEWAGQGDVMIGFGGGHYAPRHSDIAIRSGLPFGHILANYALVFDGENQESPSGPWRHSLREAVKKTRIAFPGGIIFAHLDRKSFKGWQRNAIIEELSYLDVDVLRGREIIP
ncbi:MAG: D-aminoacyl-tRNA deacylase [Candidatus Poseidoniales archaeon]|nr:D-aminoacyl-tRNA deacylase [Candidatus Poseidoniales archaeon]